MNKKRPININPLSIKLPITAWVSISHRLSGIFVFLLIPMVLWSLELSLSSPAGFQQMQDNLKSPICVLTLWVLVAAFLFHLVAGIRHLLMDMHVGVSLQGGKQGAWLTIGLTLLLWAAAFIGWGIAR